ncbi:hypothetical protein X975_09418, partial [Stegodyphus mimosarum]
MYLYSQYMIGMFLQVEHNKFQWNQNNSYQQKQFLYNRIFLKL